MSEQRLISGESRKVQLRGGGSLSVNLALSYMDFGEDEQALLDAILAAMHDYEYKHRADSESSLPAPPSPAQEPR